MWIVPNLDKRISVIYFIFWVFPEVDTCTAYFCCVLYRYLQFGALSTTDKDPLTVTIQSIQRDLNSIIQSQSSEGLTHQVNYHHLHHPYSDPVVSNPTNSQNLFPRHLHVQNEMLNFKFFNRPYVHVFRFQ